MNRGTSEYPSTAGQNKGCILNSGLRTLVLRTLVLRTLVLLSFNPGTLRGGGQTFFRAFINSELGLPEVAPCMARTFGGVSGHQRQTGSEPHPAQIWSQK